MLLEFSVKNYRSFREKMTFSMLAAAKQKGLDYSVVSKKNRAKKYKILSSAIIYGPNASGKSNIIGVLDTFKSIILRGNIRNSNVGNNPNMAANALELIPNNTIEEIEPVEFSIKFLVNELVFWYDISIDLGKFLDENYNRRILKETLFINDKLIFDRSNNLEFGDFKVIKDYIDKIFLDNRSSAIKLAENNLKAEELFLTNGFKNIFSSKLVDIILEWITKKLIVIYRADAVQAVRKISVQNSDSVHVINILNKAAKQFGIGSNALGYIFDDKQKTTILCSLFQSNGYSGIGIPAEIFESYGTIRFVNLFPIIADALTNGGTLVIDEFDASIHPMALINIVNIFHNLDININNAQLIVNSHNPIFLNSNIYRRDEIHFVERDAATHCSSHYTLADFGTSGKFGVRNNEDYLKNYFVNRYGGITDIDFTPVFEEIINNQKKVQGHVTEDK